MTPGPPCDRFESEGLLRLEQGLPLDDHFATCPDCLAARAAYARLQEEIATAGAGLEPPPYWQSRVRATIADRRKRSFRLWLWLGVPAALAAALLILVLATGRWSPRPTPEAPLLLAEIEPGPGAPRRGDEPHPGDRLILRATPGSARHVELRVYLHDTELVLRCSSAPPCVRRGDELQATLILRAPGSYQPLLLISDRPLPEPSAGLDRDAGAALAASAQARLGREIRVR